MAARSMASTPTTLNVMGDSVRAEVVGSLLRPAALVELRKQHDAGELDASHFKHEEDQHVEAAIRMQEDAGIDVITDGEQRRYAFFGHLVESFDGFEKEGGWAIPFRDEKGEELIFKRPVVVGKLRWRHSMCAEDWTFLRAKARRPGKVTMISAQQAAAYYDPEKSRDAYPTRDAYLADIVDVSRREIDELVRLGCTYVQIDAPQYAALLDPKIRAGYRERGSDPEQLIDRCIELDNAIFEKTLFNRFLLEYDDQRSGGFEPLRHLPEDRVAVLGLVTTKKPRLETDDELKHRIEEASRFVPLERLALSPQCGFASTMEG